MAKTKLPRPAFLPTLLALTITATEIGIFRLFAQRDLMAGGAWFHHHVIHALAMTTALALIPAATFLVVARGMVGFVAPGTSDGWSRGTRVSFWVIVSGFVYLWGYAASRHAFSTFSDSLWAHAQGGLALFVFGISFLATERLCRSLSHGATRYLVALFTVVWLGGLLALPGLDSGYLSRPLDRKAAQKAAQEASPDSRSFLVLGVDGMDWTFAKRKMAAGEMPNLSSLLEEGCGGPLHTLRPTSSPFVWNSIYTGLTPGHHRLRPSVVVLPFGVIYRRTHGALPDLWQSPAAWLLDANRRLHHYPLAVWEVMERAGFEIAVLGDWTSGPRRDFGLAHLSVQNFAIAGDEALDLSREHVDPRLAGKARDLNLPPAEIPREEWASFVASGDPAGLLGASAEAGASERRTALFRRMVATDRFRFRLGREVLHTVEEPYYLFVYSQSIDIAQHYFLGLHEGRDSSMDPDLETVIEHTYEWVDEWIGEMVRNAPPGSDVLILSDHGIDHDFVPDHRLKTGVHHLAPDGVFVYSGEAVRPEQPNVHVLDVAPTLLARAGLPLLATQEGRPVCGTPDPYPVVIRDWHTMEPTQLDMGDPGLLDQETREMLRSLGYSE